MAPDLQDLMLKYAKQGIDHWNAADNAIKLRARTVLEGRVADSYHEAYRTIKGANPVGNGGAFIPMPTINHDGIRFCFFLPMRMQNDGIVRFSFDLFLLIDADNCLGFRFEPADAPNRTHGYGHVQMNRKMLNGAFEPSGVPNWLSDSYPAFPIGTSDPLQMFLVMAMSVHGHGSECDLGMSRVLRETFPNSPRDAKTYIDELRCLLN